MRGHGDIDRSTSHCVAFVEAGEVDAELDDVVQQIRRRGFRIACIDCLQ